MATEGVRWVAGADDTAAGAAPGCSMPSIQAAQAGLLADLDSVARRRLRDGPESSHGPRTTAHAIAIVGVGAILPDAPDAAAFWKNVSEGRYSISEVDPERWDPALYYDPDPKAPERTYSKIGGWVRDWEWDPLAWSLPIPPKVADAMDDAQKWARRLHADGARRLRLARARARPRAHRRSCSATRCPASSTT